MAQEVWLLDANVLTFLFRASTEDAIQRALTAGLSMAVPQRVLDELRRSDPNRAPWAARFRAWALPSELRVLDPVSGSAEFERFAALRRRYAAGGGTRDEGEHWCIAHAMEDDALIFVAHDKVALWRAVHEIRPSARVASAAVFFDRLEAYGAIDRVTRDALGALLDARHLPTWW